MTHLLNPPHAARRERSLVSQLVGSPCWWRCRCRCRSRLRRRPRGRNEFSTATSSRAAARKKVGSFDSLTFARRGWLVQLSVLRMSEHSGESVRTSKQDAKAGTSPIWASSTWRDLASCLERLGQPHPCAVRPSVCPGSFTRAGRGRRPGSNEGMSDRQLAEICGTALDDQGSTARSKTHSSRPSTRARNDHPHRHHHRHPKGN